MKKVIVIGGGPAGMIAAYMAAKNGASVELFEQNEKLGKKLFITGKGRCNVTNACDAEKFFENVVSNPKFLYSAFYDFTNKDLMGLISSTGCHLKTERGERVFPYSDHSSDIIKAFLDLLHEKKVIIHLNCKVSNLIVINEQIEGVILKNGEKITADSVIIATGGISYPSTGASGDGLQFAKKQGHMVTELKPALVPLEIKEEFCKELQGLSLKNINASIFVKNKEIYSGFGEMLFTHFGVSGPLILSGSSYLAKREISGAVLRIDLKPALTEEQLDKRIIRDFDESKNKQFKNVLSGLFPAKLIPIMIECSMINPDKKVNEITKEERKHLVKIIKNFDMTIMGTRGFEEAIITQGGVSTKEINPSTMESKKIKNLFFAGEMIDVDALTGGFNLQIAWSTGALAGNKASIMD